jgi:hypothetical protein
MLLGCMPIHDPARSLVAVASIVPMVIAARLMSMAITIGIAMETAIAPIFSMSKGALAALRKSSAIAEVRVILMIHVAVETTWPVKPRTSADKQSAVEPLRPIVPIRRAVIGRVIEIPIRAGRRGTDTDGNLCPRRCRCRNSRYGKGRCCQRKTKSFHKTHNSPDYH